MVFGAEVVGMDMVESGRPERAVQMRAPDLDKATLARIAAGQRLRSMRIAAGFSTAAEAARALGVSEVTYQHHENGRRSITKSTAEAYAAYFNVSPLVLLHGADRQKVPLIGAVTAGGKVIDRETAGQTFILPEYVSVPRIVEGELVSLVVLGNDLYPAYRDGDLVFYEPALRSKTVDTSLSGVECVVEVEDGTTLLCVPHIGEGGLWTLTTYAAAPRFGVRLLSAARVQWVQRGGFKEPMPS